MLPAKILEMAAASDPDAKPDCMDADLCLWELLTSVGSDTHDVTVGRATFWKRIEELLIQQRQADLGFEYQQEARRISVQGR